MSIPPLLGMHTTYTNYNSLIPKKNKRFFIPVKYNHTCTKEVNLMPFERFSNFKIFLLKMKKMDNYGSNYHRYRVQPLVLRILRCSF